MLFQVSHASAAARCAFPVSAKPAGARCNLNCSYCFYLEKAAQQPKPHLAEMSPEVLEAFIAGTIAAQPGRTAEFVWQGGEPTLLGVSFYRRVMELQNRHADGRKITNMIQTNGLLLNDEWGEFFARHGWIVGLSIDGPGKLHDACRRDRTGGGSFRKTARGLDVLQRHGVTFHTLTVVSRQNAQRASELYTWLRDSGAAYAHDDPLDVV